MSFMSDVKERGVFNTISVVIDGYKLNSLINGIMEHVRKDLIKIKNLEDFNKMEKNVFNIYCSKCNDYTKDEELLVIKKGVLKDKLNYIRGELFFQ